MYNKIIIAGNLTRDIEIRYTQSGSAIGNTGVASTRKFKAADGSQKEEVLFVDLTFFGRTAEIANQYLRKGSKILVDGRLKLDQWEKDGQKHSKHSITVENLTMLGNKDDNQGAAAQTGTAAAPQAAYGSPQSYAAPSSERSQQPAGQPTSNIPEIDINEDEIPF